MKCSESSKKLTVDDQAPQFVCLNVKFIVIIIIIK